MSVSSGTEGVLIVGAGPVGLALACDLLRHGVPCRVVERNAGPSQHSKAIGIHARTLEIFHDFGIADRIVRSGHPLHTFGVWEDGKLLVEAGFDHISARYPYVLAVPQYETERHLLDRMRELGGSVDWQTTLTTLRQVEGGVEVELEGPGGGTETATYRWLVGCDGGRSSVRSLAGIAFEGWSYGNSFIVGDVTLDWSGPREQLNFFLSRNGYLLVIPLPEGRHRLIAQMNETFDDFQRERPPTDIDTLTCIVNRNGPGGMTVTNPVWISNSPFYHRTAATCRTGNVFIMGDAFHLFSPLGAQGLNTGVQDAYNLGWKLGYVARGLAGEELLDTYAEERMRIAHQVASTTASITRFITNTNWAFRTARKLWLPRYGRTAAVQKDLPWRLSGLRQNYHGLSLAVEGPDRARVPLDRRVLAGERAPHAWVRKDDRSLATVDLIEGTDTHILLFCRRIDGAAYHAALDWMSRVEQTFAGVRCRLVVKDVATPSAGEGGDRVLHDESLALFQAFAVAGEAAFVVRPDGYLAYRNDRLALERVDGFLGQFLRPRGAGRSEAGQAAVRTA